MKGFLFEFFEAMVTTKSRPMKSCVDEGNEFVGKLGKLCKIGGVGTLSKKGENEAAFADCTLRCLKNVLDRYLEQCGCKYLQNMSNRICPLKILRIPIFLSILYSKPLHE